jgi:hypothetical protein
MVKIARVSTFSDAENEPRVLIHSKLKKKLQQSARSDSCGARLRLFYASLIEQLYVTVYISRTFDFT